MWLLVAREPRPDAPDWPGRRLLAAIDAVAWPLLWVLITLQVPASTGVLGPVVAVGASIVALARLRRALLANHRYWFTSWRWGKVMAAMVLLAAALKLATVT